MINNKPVFFIGMKHCGKSTHAKLYAERVGLSFVDIDDMIEEIYLEESGQGLSCREIYRDKGKETFMEYEFLAIERILSQDFDGVIALGGGVASNTKAIERLRGSGFFVYIEVEPEILFDRIKWRGLPPFLDTENPYQTFLELYEQRSRVYQDLADIVICPENTDRVKVAELIYQRLKGLR
ncbi:MAG: shikimate kinase [Spirochaetales bacterium]|nr:shikimate kinase [Spirochaetales bacterium]